jgi:hypothetical protein
MLLQEKPGEPQSDQRFCIQTSVLVQPVYLNVNVVKMLLQGGGFEPRTNGVPGTRT